jgi:hypothetical protein
MSFVDQNLLKFHTMYDYVHVDEKWFYITKNIQNYYQLMDEEQVHRTAQSKRFITKVTFIATVARPRCDPSRKTMFDGKIGIWPFVYQEEAKRASKNRPRGTMVTKNIKSVNKLDLDQVAFQLISGIGHLPAGYLKSLLEKVIPAIKAKWQRGSKNMLIKIQQDNDRPHCSPNNPVLVQACTSDGWNIALTCQPPNSPDCNVLDLEFLLQYSLCNREKLLQTLTR